MRVHIHLADVVIFHGSIGIESSPRVGHLPLGRMNKCVCQRSAHLIESLVLHENGVVEAVQHSQRCQGETAEDKHRSCAVHDKPPACASIHPLQRSTATNMPNNAAI